MFGCELNSESFRSWIHNRTGSKEELLERLQKTQETLSRIGSVNLRSLEVYDQVKKEYDSVRERAELIDSEKSGILKIIHEIDIKKKKTFLKRIWMFLI